MLDKSYMKLFKFSDWCITIWRCTNYAKCQMHRHNFLTSDFLLVDIISIQCSREVRCSWQIRRNELSSWVLLVILVRFTPSCQSFLIFPLKSSCMEFWLLGKFVVKESIRRGYDTVAIVREGSEPKDDFFKGKIYNRSKNLKLSFYEIGRASCRERVWRLV